MNEKRWSSESHQACLNGRAVTEFDEVNLIDALSLAPVFTGCNRSTLEELAGSAGHRLRHKEEGAHIAYMDDELTDAVILVEGTIYSSMTNQEGKEVVVETLTGPVMLAPAFLFAMESRFPVNVIAKTDCTVLYIPKQTFREWLHRDPQLMMNFIGIISNRCQRLSQRLNDFALQSLKERVMEYLRLHQRIDSVEWLAKVLGVARPSLSRVLSELKAEGLIERTLKGIEMKKSR